MPAIDVAMQRSLKDGFLELLAASLRPGLERRDIQGQITDVKTAFSSWDNCMKATYCKWPVIAIIIIGGLMIFSVVWCIIRCACCGLSCCCDCFQCLKCCGNCCGCCDPPRGSRSKYLDEPYIPPQHQPYKSQPPMDPRAGPFAASPIAYTAPKPAVPDLPQYAEFDVSKKDHEDALPAMPQWEGPGSKKVKVAVEEEAVELSNLKPESSAAQNVPLMAGGISGPASPSRSPDHRNPYGPPPAAGTGYFPPAGSTTNGSPYGQNSQNGYGRGATTGTEPGYGMAAGNVGPGRRYNDGGYGDEQGYPAAAPQGSDYGQGSPYDNYNTPPAQGYGHAGRGNPMGGGYPQDPMRRSPAPQPDYGGAEDYDGQASYPGTYDSRPNNDRQFSSESTRPLRAPQRQYSHDVMPTPPQAPQANGGFDFGSGYSRPPVAGGNSYRQGSPALPEQQQSGYGRADNYRQASPPVPEQQQQQQLGYNRSLVAGGNSYRQASPSVPEHQQSGYNMGPAAGGNTYRQPSPVIPEQQQQSGYSRAPATSGNNYRQPSPVVPEQSAGYPGYKAYQPSSGGQQGWTGL
ncbi:hypothetical protein B0T22DRAFT_93866 [Podospora appendiculata]|uniref:Fibroin-3 related protein n=1 Tax=Podospora appendiculata TaxID=314037 RepID=A0AAE0XKC7_9PEZI|nr:hypothetical protein B0T22DRAFT_93866 [Podospora appendiculata]